MLQILLMDLGRGKESRLRDTLFFFALFVLVGLLHDKFDTSCLAQSETPACVGWLKCAYNQIADDFERCLELLLANGHHPEIKKHRVSGEQQKQFRDFQKYCSKYQNVLFFRY